MKVIKMDRLFSGCLVNVPKLGAKYFWRDAYKNEVDIVLPGQTAFSFLLEHGND